MYGLRGSSLREIARDAGVSLTLVDHYFGTKAMLLEAVVGAHRERCQQMIAPLKASLSRATGDLNLERLVGEWADYEFALSETRQGRHNLNLNVRLSSDSEIDSALRATMNCSEQVFVDAFGRLRPDLDTIGLGGAWILASATMYDAVLNIETLYGSASSAGGERFRDETKRYVTNGLSKWHLAF